MKFIDEKCECGLELEDVTPVRVIRQHEGDDIVPYGHCPNCGRQLGLVKPAEDDAEAEDVPITEFRATPKSRRGGKKKLEIEAEPELDNEPEPEPEPEPDPEPDETEGEGEGEGETGNESGDDSEDESRIDSEDSNLSGLID